MAILVTTNATSKKDGRETSSLTPASRGGVHRESTVNGRGFAPSAPTGLCHRLPTSTVSEANCPSSDLGFDPRLWLDALTSIGGGYALTSGRRLAFLVDHCDGEALTGVMAQIVGKADRQEALRHAIERRQAGEV